MRKFQQSTFQYYYTLRTQRKMYKFIQIYHSKCLFWNKWKKRKKNGKRIPNQILRKARERKKTTKNETRHATDFCTPLSNNFQLINFGFSSKFTWLIWVEFLFLSTWYIFFINGFNIMMHQKKNVHHQLVDFSLARSNVILIKKGIFTIQIKPIFFKEKRTKQQQQQKITVTLTKIWLENFFFSFTLYFYDSKMMYS